MSARYHSTGDPWKHFHSLRIEHDTEFSNFLTLRRERKAQESTRERTR